MKSLFYVFIILAVATLPLVSRAELSEDDLKPFEKVLPEDFTPKEIAEWTTSLTYRDDLVNLKASTYKVTLSSRDLRKLQRREEVRIQVAGEVTIQAPGKKAEAYTRGSACVSVISTGDEPKLIDTDRIRLSKFCPS